MPVVYSLVMFRGHTCTFGKVESLRQNREGDTAGSFGGKRDR